MTLTAGFFAMLGLFGLIGVFAGNIGRQKRVRPGIYKQTFTVDRRNSLGLLFNRPQATGPYQTVFQIAANRSRCS